MSTPRILLIGASVRAAAESAVRAGWQVVASDMYGDTDLRAIADFVPVEPYPSGFPNVLANHALPVLYTGGLENHPAILNSIETLWGNAAEPLRQSRDPFFWTPLLASAGITTADIRPASSPRPNLLAGWLVKELRSAGGGGVRTANINAASNEVFFQKFVPGQVMSAVFIGHRAGSTLCGSSLQLVRAVSEEVPFAYAGSVGPVALPDRVQHQLVTIGNTLAMQVGLRGLFGVDFVLANETVVPIEINPRYTASVEVLELANSFSLLPLHRTACVGEPTSSITVTTNRAAKVIAKVVLYATEHMIVSNQFNQLDRPVGSRVADIPTAGTEVPINTPLCTLLCEAPSMATAARKAAELAARLTPNASAQLLSLNKLAAT